MTEKKGQREKGWGRNKDLKEKKGKEKIKFLKNKITRDEISIP